MLTLELGDVKIHCETAEDLRAALAVLRPGLMRQEKKPEDSVIKPDSVQLKLEVPPVTVVPGLAVQAVRVIVQAGKKGLKGSKVATSIGLTEARGLGPVFAAVKNAAKRAGLKPEDVIIRGAKRMWEPGPKADEFLAAVNGKEHP